MKKARFWTGVVILMSPLMVMLLAEYGSLMRPLPTVDGRVMYHGRPMRNHYVVLAAPDQRLSSDMIGNTDGDGYFRVSPRWWNPNGHRLPFRIRVYPDPRVSWRRFAQDESSAVAEATSASPLRRRTGEVRRVALASLSTGVSKPSGVQGRKRQTGPDPLKVSLGAEPVYLDIELKD